MQELHCRLVEGMKPHGKRFVSDVKLQQDLDGKDLNLMQRWSKFVNLPLTTGQVGT